MLHAEHGRLLNSRGQNILVQGVSCWFGEAPDAVDPDHDEADYERVAAMGFNSIRFHFNYNAFEDDSAPYQYKDSGFARFDQSIAWAKAHGIQLVLSLGVPQGGSQLNCGGTALWDIPDNQDRVVALWRAIAQRYATEPTLAGYSLIDQPSPTSSLAQWQSLANRIAAAIREVDVQHLLVVDQATPIGCNYDNQYNPGASLIVLDDPNVLYALAAYWPWVYTNQLTAGSHLEDAGAYPDEERLGTSDFQDLTLLQTHPGSPLLTPDETTWTRKRFYYTAVNQTAQIAQVSLRSANNPGTVYFDDLLVEEFDPDFNFVRTLIDADLEDPTNWNLYQDPAGAGAGVKGTGADGHRGSASITLSGTTGEASLNFSDLYAFPLRQNYTYRVTGWMKGENSAPNSASMIGLNLYTDIGSVPPPRNKANLAAMLQRFVDWGHSHDVPLYVGDLGTGAPSFENGRGGLTWVSDMVDLMTQANLSFSYSEYHGADYGIYRGDGGPVDPSNANQPLIDLFTQKLGQ
ncbi:MAG: cellulase family glycosylhydrolase [Polyangiaceae bacterium]